MGISTNSKKGKEFNEINITPLTDIFLVLLIIMMVIAPLLDQQGLNLIVPNNQEAKEKPKDTKLITINVMEDDTYTIDEKPVTTGQLVFAIKEAARVKTDGLLIQSASEATHGAVVSVMDAARNAGVNSISVIEK
jgi:biopolymer transport protein ExbD/biopolymer transport protein TolR